MSEERFELNWCLFNENDMDFIRDKETDEEYVVLDEVVPILNQQDQEIRELRKDKEDLKYFQKLEIQQIYNEKNAEIELYEKKLSNAIVPKFKIGSKVYFKKSLVYFVDGKDRIMSGIITGFMTNKTFNWYEIDKKDLLLESHLFATKEEALAKLRELKGE